ncbi:hypothetical protein Btru_017539 [Bulinus truncatus]|nr:hypothetical protein Btru_017539 [Bulinus truncatus]
MRTIGYELQKAESNSLYLAVGSIRPVFDLVHQHSSVRCRNEMKILRYHGSSKTTTLSVFDIEVHYEGEEGGPEANVGCQKDHTRYIRCDDFQISHLPAQYQQQDIYDMLNLMSDLTVKLKLLKVSPARPQFYPGTDTPYPFYNQHQSKLIRNGSGRIFEVLKLSEDVDHKTCPCEQCQKSSTPNRQYGEVNIITSTHVIFDELEARSTQCCVKIQGRAKVCVIKGLQLKDGGPQKRQADRHCVSHPHGGEKKVSIGNWTRRERELVVDEGGEKLKTMYTVYTYDTCTCPWSSGAPVINFGKKTPFFNHIHCGSGKFGNFSSAAMEEKDVSREDQMEAIMEALGHPEMAEEFYEALLEDLTNWLNT